MSKSAATLSLSELRKFGLYFFKTMLKIILFDCEQERCVDYPKCTSTCLSRLNKVYRSLVNDKDTAVTMDEALKISMRAVLPGIISYCYINRAYSETCDVIFDVDIDEPEPVPDLIIFGHTMIIMVSMPVTPEETPDDVDVPNDTKG